MFSLVLANILTVIKWVLIILDHYSHLTVVSTDSVPFRVAALGLVRVAVLSSFLKYNNWNFQCYRQTKKKCWIFFKSWDNSLSSILFSAASGSERNKNSRDRKSWRSKNLLKGPKLWPLQPLFGIRKLQNGCYIKKRTDRLRHFGSNGSRLQIE